MSKVLPVIVHHFDCECHSEYHIARFTCYPGELPHADDKFGYPPELYASFQMNNWSPWYKRLFYGIKYIFGYESRNFYHWDCWSLAAQDVDKLQNVLTEYKIHYENWEKAQPK